MTTVSVLSAYLHCEEWTEVENFVITMSDDMLMQFSSNSSNQSDQSLPTKIAKLEARMVGKASSATAAVAHSQQAASWSVATKFPEPPESLPNEHLSSDSVDNDVSV